jgi:hypothetical protein
MVATSAGITARVLGDLGVPSTYSARSILAAAVFDDVLGMVLRDRRRSRFFPRIVMGPPGCADGGGF